MRLVSVAHYFTRRMRAAERLVSQAHWERVFGAEIMRQSRAAYHGREC